ncbi:MAG TPA: MazG family protein, partial [Chloroflexi bacterium]|nr:MazG family protein [Chloroflexota bacterium]
AVEAGEFTMAEVIAGVDAKIKRRHPHVWGERAVSGVEEVLRNWEALKQAEKANEGRPASVLDGVPKALPALTMAYTYGRRAARVGFDWTQVDGVVDKIREEIEEVATASDPESRARELGDLLFAVVNWARWLDVDPEAALREANARFARRFRWMEARVRELGLDMKAMDLDELEALWQQAKQADGRAEAEQ